MVSYFSFLLVGFILGFSMPTPVQEFIQNSMGISYEVVPSMGEATGRLLAMNLFKVGSSYDLST
jgi:hypothetical protein